MQSKVAFGNEEHKKERKLETILLNFFIYSYVVCKAVYTSLALALTHCRLNELPHNIYNVLEDSNFDFRYVRLYDLDIPRENG